MRTGVAVRPAAMRESAAAVAVARPRSGATRRPASGKSAGKQSVARPAAKRLDKRTARAAVKPVPARVVKIKELNAQGKCGPGTSVVHLFRVDEVCNGTPAVHLVFFDRHGWYCEHGRSCPAVEDVRKLARPHLARTY
jgi:hypothetical protein